LGVGGKGELVSDYSVGVSGWFGAKGVGAVGILLVESGTKRTCIDFESNGCLSAMLYTR
jgi:hypothetical protein